MADNSLIEWTNSTWNVITGCEIDTPGCINCYAMRLAGSRLRHHPSRKGLTKVAPNGKVIWNGDVRFNKMWLTQPLQWSKPRKIFVCAHGDLFYEAVPDHWIDEVFAVMACCPQHTFQVLTKRARRMREYLTARGDPDHTAALRWATTILRMPELVEACGGKTPLPHDVERWRDRGLPNVWLGVSTERQKEADDRVVNLLRTPAAIRYVSAEPLIGPINFAMLRASENSEVGVYRTINALNGLRGHNGPCGWSPALADPLEKRLDWVIVGGESGPGHRPMDEAWAAGILDQCSTFGVAAFMKQMAGKKPIPPPLQVRDFPIC